MLKHSIYPRFNDTDALGHVNHSVIMTWFEESRRPVFKFFNESLDIKKWNLIIARIEVDYKEQISYADEAIVETTCPRIGNSSFTLNHKVYQNGNLCAECNAILVHFDYERSKSIQIPDQIKTQLKELSS